MLSVGFVAQIQGWDFCTALRKCANSWSRFEARRLAWGFSYKILNWSELGSVLFQLPIKSSITQVSITEDNFHITHQSAKQYSKCYIDAYCTDSIRVTAITTLTLVTPSSRHYSNCCNDAHSTDSIDIPTHSLQSQSTKHYSNCNNDAHCVLICYIDALSIDSIDQALR